MTAAVSFPRKQQPAYDYASLEEAFPNIDPGMRPFGERVLVQIRTPKTKSAGGILLDPGTRETDKWNAQVAKVIARGPLAFHNRDTLKLWPEGEWCEVGAYVRVPKYGGDRFEVAIPGSSDKAMFAVFKDLEIIGEVTCDPLSVIAFI